MLGCYRSRRPESLALVAVQSIAGGNSSARPARAWLDEEPAAVVASGQRRKSLSSPKWLPPPIPRWPSTVRGGTRRLEFISVPPPCRAPCRASINCAEKCPCWPCTTCAAPVCAARFSRPETPRSANAFDFLFSTLAGQPTGRLAALQPVATGSALPLGLFGVETAFPEAVAARSCKARRPRFGRPGEGCMYGACARSCSESVDCGAGKTCVHRGCTTICANAGDCTGTQGCIREACGAPAPVARECVPDQDREGIFCFGNVRVRGCAKCGDADFACESLLGESICAESGSSCSPASPCLDTERATYLFGMCVAF